MPIPAYAVGTMIIKNFKVTFNDFFGALWDVAFMCIRPGLCVLIWNFGVAINNTVPEINFLQAVSIIVIYHVLLSYVPFGAIVNNKNNTDEK